MSFRRLCCTRGLRLLVCLSVLVITLTSGAFAAGLPGEYLVTPRWRAIHNNISPLSNPANIAEENYIAVRAAVAPVLGTFTLSEFGVNIPFGFYHTASFTMLMEGAGQVFQDLPDESGRLVEGSDGVSNTNLIFSFGYAWHIWRQLIIGANLNFAYQSNFGQDPLMGTGIDVGLSYRLLRHPILGDHVLGLATQNLVAPTMGYSFVPDFESAAAYARNLRLSAYSKFWESRIENYLEFDLKDFFAKADNFRATGASAQDFAKSLEWELNWRVGYWAMRMFKVYMLLGFDENVMSHWGVAVGALLPAFNQGRDLAAYYQYNMMMEDNSDATSHSFYVKADFGRHREESMARRVGRMSSLNPNELYNRGRRLHAEGKYWEAFFIFSRILVEFPDFFRNDWVSVLRADCQEQLEMREQAITNYTNVKKDYPNGEVVPYADLGLMRIYYRNNDIPRATAQFTELNRPSVPDSLRHHGTYLMGQIFLQTGELRKAVHTFGLVPDDHPEYIFAQHAVAISHAVLHSDAQEIISALENVISSTPRNKEQQEMVNRSYLFLGFMFYEENALSKAIVALRQVPGNSIYAEDALLGQGWTALKARQWGDCVAVGQQLVRSTQRPILRAEGLLIQSYGQLLQNEYNKALELLKAAHEIAQGLEEPHPDTLNMRNLRDEDRRLEYGQLGAHVEELAMIGQTAHLQGVLDSLRNRSNTFIGEFNAHQVFKYDFQRSSFFSRTVDQVKEDIEFATATVEKVAGITGAAGGPSAREQQRSAEEQRRIEAELEQLRREMQESGGESGGSE